MLLIPEGFASANRLKAVLDIISMCQQNFNLLSFKELLKTLRIFFAVKAQRVAKALPARMVAAMAGTSRAMRLALWLCPEAVQSGNAYHSLLHSSGLPGAMAQTTKTVLVDRMKSTDDFALFCMFL